MYTPDVCHFIVNWLDCWDLNSQRHCNTLQHTATYVYARCLSFHRQLSLLLRSQQSKTLQHTAAHCNTCICQMSVISSSTVEISTVKDTATHCSTLQHMYMPDVCHFNVNCLDGWDLNSQYIYIYIYMYMLDMWICQMSDVWRQRQMSIDMHHTATHCNCKTLQHTTTATHCNCNALQHTATHCNI